MKKDVHSTKNYQTSTVIKITHSPNPPIVTVSVTAINTHTNLASSAYTIGTVQTLHFYRFAVCTPTPNQREGKLGTNLGYIARWVMYPPDSGVESRLQIIAQ